MAWIAMLSENERQFILDGVKADLRADGRGCRDVRHFAIGTGVVSNTSGSAKIERERTVAIIGVKAELGEPHPSTPDQGRVEFHVDCSALAGPIYERRGGEVLSQHLAEQLKEAYMSEGCLDFKALGVIQGEQCWILYVDVLMIEVGGSALDTLSIGVRGALRSTLLPKLTVTGEGEEVEIEVSDNPHDSTPVDAEDIPIIITLHQISGEYVVDCSLEEELCSSCQLMLAVDKHGRILSTSMEGVRGIPYNKINDVIQVGLEVAKEVLDTMDSGHQDDNNQIFS